MDYIETETIKRMNLVIQGEQGGISQALKWTPQNPDLLDGDKYAHNSFVYCELAQANQQLVDEIMAANEPLKLQEVWTLLQEKGFLSYKVSPKLINEHAEDFNDLSLEDQKRFLIECLDKNMLYIPYSDIDDEGFTLSENDKQLTRQFYASR
jgi:adenine-specific DNA-methyltransferase